MDLQSYEENYNKLEKIVNILDDNELSLQDMLAKYKEGLSLVKECITILNTTEDEVKQLIEEINVSNTVK